MKSLLDVDQTMAKRIRVAPEDSAARWVDSSSH